MNTMNMKKHNQYEAEWKAHYILQIKNYYKRYPSCNLSTIVLSPHLNIYDLKQLDKDLTLNLNFREYIYNQNLSYDEFLGCDELSGSYTFRNREILINIPINELKAGGVFNNIETFPYTFYQYLSRNKDITISFIETYPSKYWDFQAISMSKHLKIKDIRKYKTEDWCFEKLSVNQAFTFDDIINNLDLPWSFHTLSENPNITPEIIKSTPYLPWNFYRLSSNPSTTIDLLLSYPNEKWNYKILSKHPNFSPAIMKQHKHLPWNELLISLNPNISFEYVISNPGRIWSSVYLGRNEMTNIKEEFIRNCYRRDFNAPDGIVNELFEVVYHPDNVVKLGILNFKY